MLTDRKARILRAIVEEHIVTGMPVGSRLLAKRYRFGVSPATIRNEMADLEETGYLDKMHTSSGRVPSDKGYRVYVDQLMPEKPLTKEESQAVESLFRLKVKDVVSLLRETVRVISDITYHLAFALGPEYENTTYKSMHLLPASENKALVVLISDGGLMESCLIDVPPMSREEMAYISGIMSDRLTNITLDQVIDRAYELLHQEMSRYVLIIEQIVEFLESITSEPDNDRLFLGGTTNLLNQPEFRDVDKLRNLLMAIENQGLIHHLLSKKSAVEDVSITIGAENQIEAIKDLSLIQGTFRLGDSEGFIGILGPRRMDYARVLSIIKLVEERLNLFFA
jgi:heat-inducible transcriptional repressor